MKPTHHAAGRSVHRLVCSRCGFVAEAGQAGWRNITSMAHVADGQAADDVRHEVALDLCRDCLREILRAALCPPPPEPPEPCRPCSRGAA